MSGLSALAKTFEENSKQQAADTEKAVQSALQQHEKSLLSALRSSEQSLNAAIQGREKRLSELLIETEAKTRGMALSGWKWLVGSFLAILLASSGGLWWTGSTLATNLALIEQQKQTMASAQALGVTFETTKDGQFIVLPKGMKAKTGWTLNNGSGPRDAIKLEK